MEREIHMSSVNSKINGLLEVNSPTLVREPSKHDLSIFTYLIEDKK